jgi:hypothetical protein
VLDESPKMEVFDFYVNEVDFLGVENILSNSLDVNAFDDYYTEKNFMFKSEEIIDPFWGILMGHEWEKMRDNRVKVELFESSMKSFKVDHHSLVVISIISCGVLHYFAFEEKVMKWIDWASE